MWKKKCKCCEIIIEYRNKLSVKNILIKINQNVDCTSENVIYILRCDSCQKYYIGKTTNQLSIRLNVHRNHIKNPEYSILPVSEHLRNCGEKYSISILFKCEDCEEIFLDRMEAYFIKLIKPELNG